MPIDNKTTSTTENEFTPLSPEIIDETLFEIQSYLAENKSLSEGIAWHLHVFCRTGQDEEYAFDGNEIEFTKHFVENLISFFLKGDNTKRFEESANLGEGYLSKYLLRLQDLFSNLMAPYCKAQIDEVEVGLYGSSLTEFKADLLISKYQKERKISSELNKLHPGRLCRRHEPAVNVKEEINKAVTLDTLKASAAAEIDRFTRNADGYQIPTGLLMMLFEKLINHDKYEEGIHECENHIESLIKFFMIPENSAAFKAAGLYTKPDDLVDFLSQSRWVFQKMQEEIPVAFFEKYNLDSKDEKEVKKIYLKYAAKNEIAANTNLTMLRYKDLDNVA